jgi:hypothetical protein
MKSWIHEIAESYVSTHKPVRRDLKENYVSLNEEQRFGLLSENVLNYLDEQLRNAYGFGVNDLTEEQLQTILEKVFRSATDVAMDSRERPVKDGDYFQTFVRGNAAGEGNESMIQPTTSLTGGGSTSDPGVQRERRLTRRAQLGKALEKSSDPTQAARGARAVEGVKATRAGEEGKAVQDAATQSGSIGQQVTDILGPERKGPLGLFGANPNRGGRADRVAQAADQVARSMQRKGSGRKMSDKEALSATGTAWKQQAQG